MDAIGTFERIFKTHLVGETDFPQPVLVVLKDGRKITALLTTIYSDTASQANGTFYFDGQVVRESEGLRNTNFLWGHEIDTITILSEPEKEDIK